MLLLLLSPRRFYYLCPNPAGLINSTANNNGNQEGQAALPGPIPCPLARQTAPFTHLACVNGIIVGGFGGCCGTISPRRGGPRCGSEISPADLNEITPVLSRLFEKRTRPPCARERERKIEREVSKNMRIKP